MIHYMQSIARLTQHNSTEKEKKLQFLHHLILTNGQLDRKESTQSGLTNEQPGRSWIYLPAQGANKKLTMDWKSQPQNLVTKWPTIIAKLRCCTVIWLFSE